MTKNVFDNAVSSELVSRINRLTPQTKPQWGKMTVEQMLAHCNVTYELAYDDKHPKPGVFMKFLLKMMVKESVVTEKPYKRNSRTGPQFLITGSRDFETEKKRLIAYIEKTQQLGGAHFHNRVSDSFGPLSTQEWNIMFYKHLNYHLEQFNV